MSQNQHSMPEGDEAPPRGVGVMAALRWLLLAAMAAAALYTVSLAVGDRVHAKSVLGHDPSGGEKQTRYHCAMHPQIVSDEPGICPICGMKLTPMGVGATPPDGGAAGVPGTMALELPEGRLQELGVRIDVARQETLSASLGAFGQLVADESHVTHVHLRVSGYVEKLRVASVGLKVAAGQPLAEIYSDELLRLQQELLQASKWRGDTAGPTRERLKLLGLTVDQIAEMEKSGRAEHDLVLKSPAAGFVTSLGVAQGDRIDPDKELFEISDLSSVWLIADIAERDIRQVKVGLVAKLRLDAYPGETFTGKVDYVYPALNTQTRTLPVRIVFLNPKDRLKPGLSGRVEIGLPVTTGVTVAAEAVVDTGEHRYVYLETGPGHYEAREVSTGSRSGERLEVLSGLGVGDRVASSGNFFIDAESRLRASVTGSPTGAPQATPPPPGSGPDCATDFDAATAPDKYTQCRTCERVHRGMGTMEADCKSSIPKPWRTP